MRASELIGLLQVAIDQYGDLTVNCKEQSSPLTCSLRGLTASRSNYPGITEENQIDAFILLPGRWGTQ